jgi:hypothetical protein
MHNTGALGDGSPYQVHNTHATPAFQRTWLKPAIIITLRGHKPCELHAVVVIEVQVCEITLHPIMAVRHMAQL